MVLKKQEEQGSLPDREWNMPQQTSASPSPVKEDVQAKEDAQTVQGEEKRRRMGKLLLTFKRNQPRINLWFITTVQERIQPSFRNRR